MTKIIMIGQFVLIIGLIILVYYYWSEANKCKGNDNESKQNRFIEFINDVVDILADNEMYIYLLFYFGILIWCLYQFWIIL